MSQYKTLNRASTLDDVRENEIVKQGLGEIIDNNPTELTIAGGAITVTQTIHTVDTEGDGISDILSTINGATVVGQVLYLSTEDAGRDVTLDENGNIDAKGANVVLDEIWKTVKLRWDGTNWVVIQRP